RAEMAHLAGGRGGGCRGEGNGEVHYGVPALVQAQVGAGGDALAEETVYVFGALAELGGESGVNGGAIDAAIQSRGRGGSELPLGARGATGRVEDAPVSGGALRQHVDVESKEPGGRGVAR